MDEGCLVGLGWMVAMDGWIGGWMMDEVSSVDEVCSNFFFHTNNHNNINRYQYVRKTLKITEITRNLKEIEGAGKKTRKTRAGRARPTLYTQALTPDRPPQAEITGSSKTTTTTTITTT